MEKKKPRKESWPKHMQGKKCGYELFENGDIMVAPMYQQEMDRLQEEKVSVKALMDVVLDHCRKALARVNKDEQELWNKIAGDYGMDLLDTPYVYRSGKIRAMPKREKPDEQQ